MLPAVPRPVIRRISSRYIAGSQLEDARRVVSRLNAKGKLATVLCSACGNDDISDFMTEAELDESSGG